jgi:F-type H+-transporting ATPase subunit gamma
MSGTTQGMRQKIQRTENLGSVVHTMKALAASNIGQYEESVRALEDYYRTIVLGLTICLGRESKELSQAFPGTTSGTSAVVIFGSDQGLVGQFNERLVDYAADRLGQLPGQKKIWAMGERIGNRLLELDLPVVRTYNVPTSIHAVPSFVGKLLLDSIMSPYFLFFNRPAGGASYEPHYQRMLPLDRQWVLEMTDREWITDQLPETLGDRISTLRALIREYLFVTLFRACADSLAAENASRLAAMQHAEKNIDNLLEELERTYHQERQKNIDEELFDIVAGFEALGKR